MLVRCGSSSATLRCRALIDIQLKEALLDHAIRKGHLAMTMLNAPAPLSLIDRAIGPAHLAKAIALVLSVLTLVNVARGPSESTEAGLLILEIISLVLVTRLRPFCALPAALTVLEAAEEFAHIERPVLPSVLTFTVWLSFLVFSCVGVPIFKEVGTLSMLKTVAPFALISIAILPSVDPVTFGLGVTPLTDV